MSAFCMGYIQGVTHTENGISLSITPMTKLCIPDDVTLSQLKDVLIAYLKDRPEERHWAAWSLVHNAINDAFPCPRQ
jgi:hypothetical protein